MEAYQLTLIGLFAEICGVFFLSVEAIKIENFKKLRDKIFVPFDHSVSFSSSKFETIFAKDLIEKMRH
jgi:hypothetical protein